MTPENLLAIASSSPRRSVAGPTQYVALKPPVHADGTRYQLASKVADETVTMLVSRTVTGDLVAAVNARNVARHKLDAALKVLRDADGGTTEEVAARESEITRLAGERSALPTIDAHPTEPVAKPLAIYQEIADVAAAREAAEQEAAAA